VNREPARVLLSWSTGKDSAWALHVLRERPELEVVGLLSTVNEAAGRVAMHAVRRELLRRQAEAADLPLVEVALPWPCSNDEYQSRVLAALGGARARGVTHVAFGDLFLEDVRAYRERLLDGTGLEPLFPLWGEPTGALAARMLEAGLRAVLTCVNPRQLEPRFAGRRYDHRLLGELPAGVDPCGERGEFHTFCDAGPMFRTPVALAIGERIERDGFWFADLTAARP
jgi:uncharacterized protein (TIGR00290 family)